MRFLLVRIYRIVRGSELCAMWKSDQALEHPCNRQILIIFNRSRSRKRELFIVGLRMQKPLSTVNSVDNLGAFLLWNLERLMNDLPSLPLNDLVQLSSYGRWFLSGKGILFFPLLDGNQKGGLPLLQITGGCEEASAHSQTWISRFRCILHRLDQTLQLLLETIIT